jgi:hypothetical protein
MVYCNQKVVLIDFHVFDSCNYPLFLEDELFQIRVERKNGSYSYGLEIDKTADTPRNRLRKVVEKRQWRQLLVFVLAFFAVAGLLILLLLHSLADDVGISAQEKMELLQYHGQESVATVEAIYEHKDFTTVRFSFATEDGRAHSARTNLEPLPLPLLSNGMKVEEGDQFALRYVSDNPGLHEIRFDQPTEQQLRTYRERAKARHQQLHPNLTGQQIDCLLDLAYEQQGIKGLAAFYFQEAAPSENPFANELAYKRLTRDPDFKNLEQVRCWP